MAADPLELPLLEDAQQLGLERRRDLAHLVEEQGAPLGRLDPADLPLDRPGEGSSLVAEELALEERLGERGAVDRHERLAGPRAAAVEGAGRHLLAGAALAAQQDGRVGGGDAGEQPLDLPDARARADHAGVQSALDPPVLLLQGLQVADVGERRPGDAGRGRRQLQMAFVEAGSRLAGIQIEDAERPLAAGQRGGEEGLEACHLHALDALPTVALEHVVRQHGRALGDDALDQGAGDGEGRGPPLAVQRAGKDEIAGRIQQQESGPLGGYGFQRQLEKTAGERRGGAELMEGVGDSQQGLKIAGHPGVRGQRRENVFGMRYACRPVSRALRDPGPLIQQDRLPGDLRLLGAGLKEEQRAADRDQVAVLQDPARRSARR